MYEYWSTRKGSEVKDFVNFGCQLRKYKNEGDANKKPFSYLRTIVAHSNCEVRD